MTKAELIDSVKDSAAGNMSKKDTAALVDSVFETLRSAIATDGRFSYPGFGTFTVRHTKAREGRNPQTGAKLQIPAGKKVNFKAAPAFKGSL